MKSYALYKKKLLLLLGILLVLILASLFIGRYPIDKASIIGLLERDQAYAPLHQVLYQIRWPRIVMVVLGGGALALAGTVYQSLFRNPLVSPDLLGVSSGCSVGAALAILYFPYSQLALQGFSFIAGLVAVGIALYMAKRVQGDKLLGLVLAGIITGAIATAFIMFLKYVADPSRELPAIDFWMMGGFYKIGWEEVKSVLPIILLGEGIVFLLRWQLKVMSLGEEQALTLGVHTQYIRLIAIITLTFLVAAVVSVAGLVSWVGLVAPHIVKRLIGDNLEYEIPLSIIVGGCLLLAADTLARSIYTAELPISILTTLVGAPFLVYLLSKKGKTRI